MNDENLNKKLNDICKQDIDIPQSFTNTIKNGLYEKNNQWRFFMMKKAVISIFCVLFLGTGVVLASSILGEFWKNNEGIKKALEYEYIQNIDMQYNEQNDLGIKLESIIIDNSNYGIVFDYKVSNKLKNISDIVLEDLLIKDENNNIIFQDGNINDLTTVYDKEIAKENDIIKQAVLLNNLNHTYPKSEKVFISFSKVNIIENEKKVKTINGNWNFEIDVIDKFITRDTIKYSASQNSEVEVIKAELTPTGLDIEMKFSSPQDAEKLANNIKIQDKLGKEYSIINGICVEDENIKPIIKTTFPITMFNVEDDFKLIIRTDKEIIIDLIKICFVV